MGRLRHAAIAKSLLCDFTVHKNLLGYINMELSAEQHPSLLPL